MSLVKELNNKGGKVYFWDERVCISSHLIHSSVSFLSSVAPLHFFSLGKESLTTF